MSFWTTFSPDMFSKITNKNVIAKNQVKTYKQEGHDGPVSLT